MSTNYSDADLEAMDDATLLRKSDQAWDMAGLARQDGDMADAERQTKFAQRCDAERHRRAMS